MILPDNETKVDLLNNEAIAKDDHRPVAGSSGQPGDHRRSRRLGRWQVQRPGNDRGSARKEEKVLCLKFNGWRFQGFEDAKIALIEGIVNGLLDKRPVLSKATGALKDVVRSIDLLKVAKKAGGLAWTAFTGIPTADQISGIVKTLQGIMADPAALATKENIGQPSTESSP
jgi:hypothetical protein